MKTGSLDSRSTHSRTGDESAARREVDGRCDIQCDIEDMGDRASINIEEILVYDDGGDGKCLAGSSQKYPPLGSLDSESPYNRQSHHDVPIDKHFTKSTRLMAKFLQEQESELRFLNAKKLIKQSEQMKSFPQAENDLLLATLLQEEEYEAGEKDQQVRNAPFASIYEERTKSDLVLAQFLQEQETESQAFHNDALTEHEEMKRSPYGKAVIVVQKIFELQENFKAFHPNFAQYIDTVSTDDMVFLAKNLLETQAKFLQGSVSAYVDTGYHYTNAGNLDSIRTNGLMTKNERDSQGISSDRFNGSSYGDGVYTGNDPMTFSHFGDTGLIVGRLLGSMKNYQKRSGDENTVLVPEHGMIVLSTSVQCLPMIKFDKTLVASKRGKTIIGQLQKSLQQLLDDVFNPGLTAPMFKNFHSKGKHRGWATTRARRNRFNNSFLASMPNAVVAIAQPIGPPNASVAYSTRSGYGTNQGSMPRNGVQQGALHYGAPEKLHGLVNHAIAFGHPPTSYDFQSDCSICQCVLSNPQACVALKACSHVFHKACIEQACKFAAKCPSCRVSIGTPVGKCPSGSMTVSVNTGPKCGGFRSCNTITIVYSIPQGIQKHYHENPGQSHRHKLETAYLPNTIEGQNLLKRLKFAFMHGLTFTVGTSMTTGATNQCTWSSVHHKTSANGGVHGFPDPNYFANCNGELDNLDVPAADELDLNGGRLQK